MIIKNIVAAVAAMVVAAPAFSTVLYTQDFESGSSGFSGGRVQGSQGFSSYGYGSKLWWNDGTSTLSFSTAQAATGATLSLSLAILDTWDGNSYYGPDHFRIRLDGTTTLFDQIFGNYGAPGPTSAPGLTTVAYNQSLGFTNYIDAAYTVSLSLGNLSAGSHTLTFQAYGTAWQGSTDESYGLDNVTVSGNVASASAIPEPASLALAALGLGGLGWMRRRRQG